MSSSELVRSCWIESSEGPLRHLRYWSFCHVRKRLTITGVVQCRESLGKSLTDVHVKGECKEGGARLLLVKRQVGTNGSTGSSAWT